MEKMGSAVLVFYTCFNYFLVFVYSAYKFLHLSLLHGIRKVWLFSVKFVFAFPGIYFFRALVLDLLEKQKIFILSGEQQ